jgi:isoquinoline 1-oxidoreductase beta subunit
MSSKKDNPNECVQMDRRRFLTTTAVVGGGMAVGFWLPPGKAEAAVAPTPVTAETALRPENWYRESQVPEINAWFTIGPDDTVTIRCQNVDIGTSIPTTNAMIVADELQCDWNKVRIEFASPNRDATEKAPAWTLVVPGGGNAHDPAGGGKPDQGGADSETGMYRHMGVGSSGNVRESRYYLQYAGAEGRERLLLAASQEWGVPVSELIAKDSVITHTKSKRRTTYGAVAARAAQIQLPDPGRQIKIKSPD